MILTCPDCNTQFTLDHALLGEDGRKVKCSSCDGIWFQRGKQLESADDEEPALEEKQDDSQDVMPPPAPRKDPPSLREEPLSPPQTSKKLSYGIAAFVFVVIALYLLMI